MSPAKKPERIHVLDFFLVFIPISLALYYTGANPVLTLISIAASVIALSHVIVEATGILSQKVSSTISALINATFGNAIEFFIGQSVPRVKLDNFAYNYTTLPDPEAEKRMRTMGRRRR